MQHTWKAVLNARKTILAELPEDAQRTLELSADRCIYMYSHIKSKQVVYSLERVMNNHNAMKQLPILSKQMKPSSLRKDLWRPLAAVKFPSSHQRLEAYRQLREYRKRHELEWPLELRKDADGKPLPKRLLARKIADQKANSVADLAAVLLTHKRMAEEQQQKRETAETRRSNPEAGILELQQELDALIEPNPKAKSRNYRRLEGEKLYLERQIRRQKESTTPSTQTQHILKRGSKSKIRPLPDFSMEDIQIDWIDFNDRHYAERWPESVVHSSKVQDLKKSYLSWLRDLNANISALENEPSFREYLDAKEDYYTARREYIAKANHQKRIMQTQKSSEGSQATLATEKLNEMKEELTEMKNKLEQLTPSKAVVTELTSLIDQRKILLATMRVLRQARHAFPPVFTDPLLQPEAVAPRIEDVVDQPQKLVEPPSRFQRATRLLQGFIKPSSGQLPPPPPSQETGYRGFLSRLTHRAAYGRASPS